MLNNKNFEELHNLIPNRDLDGPINYKGEMNPFSGIKLSNEQEDR